MTIPICLRRPATKKKRNVENPRKEAQDGKISVHVTNAEGKMINTVRLLDQPNRTWRRNLI